MFNKHKRLFTYICSALCVCALFGAQFFGFSGGITLYAAEDDISVSYEDGDFEYSLTKSGKSRLATVSGLLDTSAAKTTIIVPSYITVRETDPITLEESNVGYDVVLLETGVFKDNDVVQKVQFKGSVKEIQPEAFSGCSALSAITLPSTLEAIGDYTFSGCTSLTAVTVPAKVKSIGENAFFGCSALEKLTIKSGCTYIGISAFEDCTALKSVRIPRTVKTIDEKAFTNCDAMTSVSFATGLETIGDFAFEDCDALQRVALPTKLESLGEAAFKGCDSIKTVTVPGSVENFGKEAFKDCTSLTTASIRSGVQAIGESAFEGCTSLSNLNLSASTTKTLTDIGESAFRYCSSLKYIELPKVLETIGWNAFEGTACVKLIIPETVIEVQDESFMDCTNLKEVEFKGQSTVSPRAFKKSSPDAPLIIYTIPCGTKAHYIDGGLLFTDEEDPEGRYIEHIWGEWKPFKDPTANTDGEKIRECERDGCDAQEKDIIPRTSKVGYTFDDSTKTAAVFDCSKNPDDVTTVVIPKTIERNGKTYTVVTIGANAFNGCDNLIDISLPNTITLIESRAFMDCTGLKYLKIPDTVESIGAGAFEGCSNLEKIDFSKSVEIIEEDIFNGCTSLKEIILPPNTKQIKQHAFEGTAITKVTIPESCDSILYGAFYNCTKLKDIYFQRHDKDEIEKLAINRSEPAGYGAFEGIASGAVFHVPCTTVDLYGGKAGEPKTDFGILGNNVNYADGHKVDGPLEHDWSKWTIVRPATTAKDGEKTRKCANCGRVENEIIPAVIILKYSYDEKTRTASVIYCTDDAAVTKVAVPSKISYDGMSYSVTGISAGAFKGRTNLTALTLPAGITYIGQDAFRGCSNLKSVTVPNSVTSVGAGAFAECTSLTKAVLPDRLTEIPDSAFEGCVALKAFKLPGNVDKIGEKAFYDSGLTSVVIPSPSTEVDSYAFGSSSNLKSVTIAGRKITSTDSSAFNNISDTATFKIPCGTTKTYSKLLSGKTVQEASHKWGKWEVAEDGSKTRTCTVCGQTENDSKNATGLEYDFIVYTASDWDKVLNTAKNIKGGTLNVDLRAKLSVPSNLLTAMKGKDIYMNLELGNGIMFQLHGKTITAVTTPLNLNAKPVTGVIPKKLVDKTANGRINYQIQIPTRKDFGLTATLIPKFKVQHYGEFANLFYYNKKANRLEFVRYSPIEDNGYAYLDITHASEYLLVISDEPMGENIELGAGCTETAYPNE